MLVSKGELRVNDQELNQGDGLEITDVDAVQIEALSQTAEVVVLDVPSH